MPQYKELRGDIPLYVFVPPLAAAAAAEVPVPVPFNAVITAAKWIPGAAITANGTNFFTLSFRNRGAAGAGTVQWATARAYSSVNGVANTPEALTLSSTASDLNIAAGDLVTVQVTHTASGLAVPAGVVALTIRGR